MGWRLWFNLNGIGGGDFTKKSVSASRTQRKLMPSGPERVLGCWGKEMRGEGELPIG